MQHLLRRGESNLFQELKAAGYYVWSNARGDLIAGQDRQWLKENFDVLYSEAGTEHGKDEGRGEKGSDTYFSFYRGVVENNSGTELPSTGGIGTTIFYIVGSLLAVGAVILLVTKKRMGKTEG